MQTPRSNKKHFFKNDFVYLFALLILSLYICWPFFKENLINTIDGGTALLHLYCMENFIGKGQWLVRWVPELYGYGYPLFNFYPPLFSFVGTILVKLGLSPVWALNLSCVLFFLLSGTMMYFLCKEFWGPEGAFLSAAAYLLAPYQMVDLYLRGAYPESASLAFLPLILWSFLKLHQTLKPIYLILASLSVAGLCLTHNCISLIFIPIIFIYIFVLHYPFQHQKIFSLLINLATFLLGIGSAAFFWLPALIEKQFVHIEQMVTGKLDFHHNFLTFKDLIYSTWPKIAGTPLPFEIGPLHCLLAIASLCFIQRITQDRRSLLPQLLFFSLAAVISIFLILQASSIIWEHIHILRYMQFPWRLLSVITLFISILAGGITLLFYPKHQLMILIAGVLALFLINFSHCQAIYGSSRANLSKAPPSFVLHNLHAQDAGEYIPIGVKLFRRPVPAEKLDFINGEGRILSENTDSPIHQRFSVANLSPTLLCFNVYYFPGWTIRVDGHPVDIIKDNPVGLIIFPVDAGLHEINADFGPTPIRLAGKIISIVSFTLLIILLFFKNEPIL